MKIDTAFGADVKALQAKLPLVESLLGCGLLAQGRPVTANLWQVNTPEDVAELAALLENPCACLSARELRCRSRFGKLEREDGRTALPG